MGRLKLRLRQEDSEECPKEEILSGRMLDAGRLILEAGVGSELLLDFVGGLIDTLEYCPSDVLFVKLNRLMVVAEGDINNQRYLREEAIRHRKSTEIWREEKRKEEARKRIEERKRLQREKREQELQAEQTDSSG